MHIHEYTLTSAANLHIEAQVRRYIILADAHVQLLLANRLNS